MKLKTRLALAFLGVTIVPIMLIFIMSIGLNNYQMKSFKKNYGLSESVEFFSGNSMQIFNRLTESFQKTVKESLNSDPEKFEDIDFLDELNNELQYKYSSLIVRKGNAIIYPTLNHESHNMTSETAGELYSQLPMYSNIDDYFEGSIYLDGETQYLIKQMDFNYPDKSKGTLFIVSKVDDLVPEQKNLFVEMIVAGILILFLAGIGLSIWVYQSIIVPLERLREATNQIKDGNLEFTMEIENNDEIGQICQDFEEMRIRLKESAEEKLQYDKESKELISNISHDLKTPITAIKGYVEGIMDGVAAATPERLNKYIKTIYNKANDMDRLIDELTYYSKIDTNKIPYAFSKINVARYFKDCVEEIGFDMEAKGIELGYFNYVDEDVVVIADAEQMKKVINNIVGNSVKYIDKKRGIINIRVKDDGDYIHVEIEDNGKGIAAKDIPNIFDRFYRTDSSRNSAQGGSGIGLSIVKKIIEDHGGKIWATSKENIGTEIHFVLRKYQEEN